MKPQNPQWPKHVTISNAWPGLDISGSPVAWDK